MTTMKSEMENGLDKAKDTTQSVMGQAKEYLKEHVPGTLEEVKDTAVEAIKMGECQVKSNPGQSIVAALAVGFGFAMLYNKVRHNAWL